MILFEYLFLVGKRIVFLCLVVTLCYACTHKKYDNQDITSHDGVVEDCYFDLDSFRADIFSRTEENGQLYGARVCRKKILPCMSKNIKMKMFSLQGYFYYHSGNYDSAYYSFTEAASLASKIGADSASIFYANKEASKLATELGLSIQARKYSEVALVYASTPSDSCSIYLNKALLEKLEGNGSEYIALLKESIELDTNGDLSKYALENLIEYAFERKQPKQLNEYVKKYEELAINEGPVNKKYFQLLGVLLRNETKVSLTAVEKYLDDYRNELSASRISDILILQIDLKKRSNQPIKKDIVLLENLLKERIQLRSKLKPSALEILSSIINFHISQKSTDDVIEDVGLIIDVIKATRKFQVFDQERFILAKYLKEITASVLKYCSSNEIVLNNKESSDILKLFREIKAVNLQYYSKTENSDFIKVTEDENISENEAIMIFITLNENWYRVIKLKDSVNFQLLPITDFNLKRKVENVTYFLAQQSDSFYQESASLKKILWPKLKASIQYVNIIPDGILSSLPFESLSDIRDELVCFNILNKYFISYSFYGKPPASSKIDIYENGLKVFQPTFKKSSRFLELSKGLKNIENINCDFNQTSSDFINALKADKLIYLRSHGTYTSGDPILWFSDTDSILISDIYSIKSRSPLVILNACETGKGKKYEIEGLVSYAYSLKYIGVNSIGVNLWQANAHTMNQVNSYFFKNLKNNNITESLTKAKRSYLESEEVSKDLRHPYFWSSLVLFN